MSLRVMAESSTPALTTSSASIATSLVKVVNPTPDRSITPTYISPLRSADRASRVRVAR